MTGHRTRATAAVLVVGLTIALTACGGSEIDPPKPPADRSATSAAGASALLDRLGRALTAHDRGAVRRLAAPDPASRRAASTLAANARALRLTGVSLRYVEADAGQAPDRVLRDYGDRAWTATVTASYRLPEDGRARTALDTRFVFADTPDGVRLAGTGGGEERGALWLSGPVQVRRGADTLVVSALTTPDRYARATDRAVTDVRRVLPGWRGDLVVEVPGSEQQLDSLLDADAGTYRAIAAVTTTVDGSLRRGSPAHVYVNPEVFDRLGDRGSQVVLSHEATHVATDASVASMPTWLLEGFADYVALDHEGIPVATSAGQILARVRRDGPPSGLPSARDLDPAAKGLGATYEEAWTACRYLGATYGEAKMVAFYDAVDGGRTTRAAFRSVLGTTQDAFVRGWRADLVSLASRGGS